MQGRLFESRCFPGQRFAEMGLPLAERQRAVPALRESTLGCTRVGIGRNVPAAGGRAASAFSTRCIRSCSPFSCGLPGRIRSKPVPSFRNRASSLLLLPVPYRFARSPSDDPRSEAAYGLISHWKGLSGGQHGGFPEGGFDAIVTLLPRCRQHAVQRGEIVCPQAEWSLPEQFM